MADLGGCHAAQRDYFGTTEKMGGYLLHSNRVEGKAAELLGASREIRFGWEPAVFDPGIALFPIREKNPLTVEFFECRCLKGLSGVGAFAVEEGLLDEPAEDEAAGKIRFRIRPISAAVAE